MGILRDWKSQFGECRSSSPATWSSALVLILPTLSPSDTEDYEVIARKVREAGRLTDIPAVILLEGGYVLDKLGGNMLGFPNGWGKP